MAATGHGHTFRSRELIGAMNRAKGVALQGMARDFAQAMKEAAHVVSGEMREQIFADVSTNSDGTVRMVGGSVSEHAAFEIARGGAHDFIHPAADRVLPTMGRRLQQALRGEGW